MQNLMNIWELVSIYKLGSDLILITQGRKNPIQALLETAANEQVKKRRLQFIYYKEKKGKVK